MHCALFIGREFLADFLPIRDWRPPLGLIKTSDQENAATEDGDDVTAAAPLRADEYGRTRDMRTICVKGQSLRVGGG